MKRCFCAGHDEFRRVPTRDVANTRQMRVRARTRATTSLLHRFTRTVVIFGAETQGIAHDRSNDEMFDDPATQSPGAPVAQPGSDCFEARELSLDVVYTARDVAP